MERDLSLKKAVIYSISMIVIIAISLIVITRKTAHGLETLKYIKLNKRYLIFSLISLFFFHLFDAIRLKIISRALNVNYSLFYGFLTSLANTFGATITPFHIGGELVTFYMLGRKGVNIHKISTIVTIKAITGTISFAVLLPVAIYFLGIPRISKADFITVAIIILALTILSLFGIRIIRYNRKMRSWFKKYIIMLLIFKRRGKKNFLLSIVCSILIYISFLSIAPFVVWSIKEVGSFFDLFVKQLLLFYGVFLSPTPGGSGVGEIGAVLVYEGILVGKDLLAFAILWRIMSQYLSGFLGALVIAVTHLYDLKLKAKGAY